MMGLPSTLFCLLLSVTLVSGHLHPDDRAIRWPRKGDPEERMNAQTRIKSRQHRSLSSQKNQECQEGNPPGASYSGRMNVTASGRTCQVWAATKPHEHDYTKVGEHNHCRNPNGDLGGVWCYTIYQDKLWGEYCDVKRCTTYNCQEGYPFGASYLG